jgi:hypothetical protein
MLQALERALPSALERSFDSSVAEFVVNVAGTSGHERRRKILAAGDALDQHRNASLEPTSPTSLSAIAIDGSESSQPAAPALDSSRGSLPGPQLRRPRSLWLGLVAVTCGTVLGLSMVVGGGARTPPASTEQPSPARAKVSAASAPLLLLPRVEDLPKAQPLPGASAEATTPSAEHAAQPKAPGVPQRRIVRKRPVVPMASATPSAKPAPSAVHEPQARVPKPASANAWDPDSFGARQ